MSVPRPARPWFRFYVEALHDRKLRRLTPAQRWLWVAILGAARQSPTPGHLLVSEREPMDATDLADIAGMPVREVERALPLFDRAGLIAKEGDTWYVPKWNGRQYESDNVTERTRKHRSKPDGENDVGTFQPGSMERRNGDEISPVGTPPESETETDTYSRRPSDSRGAIAEPVDDDDLSTVPDETWDHYATLMLAKQTPGTVKNPGPWKATTSRNARSELGETAARWYATYDVDARQLAAWLIDGQPSRYAKPREVPA